jgi:hypothetical protein
LIKLASQILGLPGLHVRNANHGNKKLYNIDTTGQCRKTLFCVIFTLEL